MENEQTGHDALAAALLEQITSLGKQDDPAAIRYVNNAREGLYRRHEPIDPGYIGLTNDEFISLRLLAYIGG